jgi:hypothetical protein
VSFSKRVIWRTRRNGIALLIVRFAHVIA